MDRDWGAGGKADYQRRRLVSRPVAMGRGPAGGGWGATDTPFACDSPGRPERRGSPAWPVGRMGPQAGGAVVKERTEPSDGRGRGALAGAGEEVMAGAGCLAREEGRALPGSVRQLKGYWTGGVDGRVRKGSERERRGFDRPALGCLSLGKMVSGLALVAISPRRALCYCAVPPLPFLHGPEPMQSAACQRQGR